MNFKVYIEHKHMTNTMNVKFIPINNNSTRYVSEVHYTKFNGFLINLMVKFISWNV